MGFYGNITNTARTQFQFDKIYPNKKAMVQACLSDGIYLGRFVLVEYDNDGLDGIKRIWKNGNQYYFSTDTAQQLTTQNTVNNEVFYRAVVATGDDPADLTATSENEVRTARHIFYKCVHDGSNIILTQINDSVNQTQYTTNYNIDMAMYSGGRGYDSTVWQKVYSDGVEKYVMIAELNTVVPTFAVVAEAPTMNPVAPHFDTQSTDVYYKLHWQAPWGFRVAAAVSNKSDITTQWTTTTYNPETGRNETSLPVSKDAAIYFNKDAFEAQVNSANIKKKDTSTVNEIKILPVSSGQKIYDDHNNATDKLIDAPDIQELTINLPAIGNMMSDAWDIIHGPNRDNARTDENGSLQGRLDSFKDMAADEIPVKRGSDGTIIGATINGGKTSNSDLTGKNDDAWIETMVNGDIESITIKHTVNKVNDTNTESNKNINQVVSNLSSDKIDLYTPIVDNMGHVVGKNTETVTLPYGYKTFEDSESGDNKGSSSADNTQDTFIFKGDSWIKPIVTTDLLTITHEGPVQVTATPIPDDTPAFGATFSINDHYFDDKGHKCISKSHKVTIPSPSLTNGTGNVVTGLAWDTTDKGKLIETKDNISNLILTGLTAVKTDAAWVQATDDIKGAFNKIDTRLDTEITRAKNAETTFNKRINNLDYTDTSTTQFISGITQTDGKIAVERAAAGTLVLGSGYSKATTSAALATTDSLNTAFGKIEKSLDDEVTTRQLGDEAALIAAQSYVNEKINELKTTTFTYGTEQKTVEELFGLVFSLNQAVAQLAINLNALEQKVNENHPVENTETTE